jgi:hypothetical protein
MLSVECARCGKTFGAQRKTAQYCSVKCRTAATRARQRDAAPPPRREGAIVVALPAKPAEVSGFLAATESKLQAAGRLDTYQGLAAMFAARMLDSGVQDTMSSMATMLREYKASMKEALEGANKVDDPVDNLLARQATRRAAKSA